MVAYEDESVFPASSEVLWKLLARHNDDSAIHQIHPLVLTQRTLSHAGADTIVERTVNARGKSLRSQWKITHRAPGMSRWEVLEGEGPWAPGSFVENRYSSVPGGTRVQTRGDLKITVLPFFLPQKPVIRRVLAQLDIEDLAALRG
jgi:hypothetical protein